MRALLRCCLIIPLLLITFQDAQARLARLTQIETRGEEAEGIEILLLTDNPVKKYEATGGSMQTPICVSLEETLNDWIPLVREMNHPLIKRISSIQKEGRTDVIIEPQTSVGYDIKEDGDTIVIKIWRGDDLSGGRQKKIDYEIVDVKMKKVSPKERKVVINASAYPQVKYFQDEGKISIDFLNAKTKQVSLQPDDQIVKSIKLSQVQDNLVRGVIELNSPSLCQVLINESNQVHINLIEDPSRAAQSAVEISPSVSPATDVESPLQPVSPTKDAVPEDTPAAPAKSADNSSELPPAIITDEVEDSAAETISTSTVSQELPAAIPTATAAKTTTAASSTVPLVTNVFFDIDIRQALKDISSQTGIPIILDDAVRGVVNLELKDVPLDKALKMILLPGGYQVRKYDDYYFVSFPDPKNPAFKEFCSLEVIELNYIKAESIPNLLSEYFAPYIHIDKTSNKVSVTAPPEIIAQIKKDIARLDTPPPRICIETLVTEIYTNKEKDSGINWNLNWKNVAAFSNDGWKYTITNEDNRQGLLNLLSLLVKDGRGEIKANPRIVTLESQPAVIYNGREEYFRLLTGSKEYGSTRLETIKTGTSLKIIPYLAENGDITVEIESEVSDVSGMGIENLPITNKRTVNTKIRVKDGETIVIGGLIQKIKTKERTGLPILGKIPLLKLVFSRTDNIVKETETVILITPRVMR